MRPFVLTLALLWLSPVGCSTTKTGSGTSSASPTDGATSGGENGDATDITNAVFADTAPDCGAHTGVFTAQATDLGNSRTFTASLTITASDTTCVISGNGIPNHDFNDTNAFATATAEVNESYELPRNPSQASATTALSLERDNAVFLNGVKLDLLAAACYGVGGEPLGEEKIGCFTTDTPWRYDPMAPQNDFGTDAHHAHTQPDGAYHYHGDPLALYDGTGATESGVIGYAADGFPIRGPWIDDGGTLRRVASGYRLKTGDRVSQTGEGAFPGGVYDGTFVDDYAWGAGNGDLDECNGMVWNGVYTYFVTDAFPWVMRCFAGTPDPSFTKSGP